MKTFISIILCLAMLLSAAAMVFADDTAILISPNPVIATAEKFTDIKADDWFHDAVYYCYNKGLIKGVSKTEYAAEEGCSRAMAAAVLWRLAGEPVVNYLMPFTDVEEDAYYTEAVRWAASEQLIHLDSETLFEPERNITREEVIALVYKYEQSKDGGFKGSWMFFLPLEDRAEVSSFATEAVYWLYMKGVAKGSEGKIYPKEEITRAEMAAVFMKYAKLSEPEEPEITPIIAGGWTTPENTEITEEIKGYFDKAMEGLVGVGYTPVKLVGTQVVAGTNYKILCDAKAMTYPVATYQAEVVIYVALDGTCTLGDITRLD